MLTIDELIVCLEWIGSIAFAISGVMVAREARMDLLGAVILGCTTAVGGGTVRDLLLGQIPPSFFIDPSYTVIAAVTALITFAVLYFRIRIPGKAVRYERILNLTDTVGLASFIIAGCQTVLSMGYRENAFLCIFVGTITGVGGGILRDLFAGQIPLVFRRRIYAVAAIIGTAVYYYAHDFTSELVSALLCIVVTITLRALAIKGNWNLPRFQD